MVVRRIALLAVAASLLAFPAAAVPSGKGACTILGTPGRDVLIGTQGNDVVCGLGGSDVTPDTLRGALGRACEADGSNEPVYLLEEV